jgi:hypothetical protein
LTSLNFSFRSTEAASVTDRDYVILAIIRQIAAPMLWLQLPSMSDMAIPVMFDMPIYPTILT